VDAHRAHALVELDRALVPIEHRPFHAGTAALDGEPRQVPEQRFTDPVPAVLGTHEQVFEIESRASLERRVVVEEQREPDRASVHAGQHALRHGFRAEQGLVHQRLGRHHFVQQLLVLGELADQGEDHPDIADRRGTDLGRCAHGLKSLLAHSSLHRRATSATISRSRRAALMHMTIPLAP